MAMKTTTLVLSVWIDGAETAYHVTAARFQATPATAAALKTALVRAFGAAALGRSNVYDLVHYTPWGANSFQCDFRNVDAAKPTLNTVRKAMFATVAAFPGVKMDTSRYPATGGLAPQHIASSGIDISELFRRAEQGTTFVLNMWA